MACSSPGRHSTTTKTLPETYAIPGGPGDCVLNGAAARLVHPGDRVIVQRAGDVIPEVVGPVLAHRTEGAEPVIAPTHCPICGTELVRKEGNVALRCPNRVCPAQIQSRIEHFVGRKMMDIEGLGEKLIARLLQTGHLTDIPSIYDLKAHREVLIGMERLGTQSVDNLLREVEASKTRPLANFLFALGIGEVGEKTSPPSKPLTLPL
ncbi:MAG: hypothetical protein C4320_02420 [Armatimonadota bacterium]